MKKSILASVLALSALFTGFCASAEHFDDNTGFSGSAAVSSARAVSANSLYLNGAAHAELKQNPFDGIGDDFTLSVWAYAEDNPNFARIFDFGTGSLDSSGNPDNYVFLTLNANYNSFYALPRFAIKQNGIEQSVTSSIAVVRNSWYSLIITKSGSSVKMYINGELAAEADNITNSAAQNFTECYIGKSHWSADANFNGYIDELNITKGAASYSEVQKLARRGAAERTVYFPMESTSELSVKNNVGTNTSNALIGKCYTFNGTNAYGRLAENPLAALRDSYTLSIWVKPREARMWSRVFDFGSSNSNYAFLTLWSNTGKPRFEINLSGNVQQINSSIAITADNSWHNVVITKDMHTAKMYIDGTLAGENHTMTNSASLLNSNLNYLGKSQFSADPLFYGYMDELEVYDRALNAEEITKMINKTIGLEVRCALLDDGKPVIALTGAEQSLCAAASLTNPLNTEITAQLIAAAYDENGNLYEVSCSDKKTVGEKPVDLRTDIDTASAKQVAFYIWSSNREQMPVCPAYRVSAYDGVNFPSLSDNRGTDEYSHDPSIFKDPGSGRYYIYNSHSYYPAVSDDLIHWESDPRGNMPLPKSVTEHYSEAARRQSQTMWAPDIIYDEKDADGMPYHLYYCYSGLEGVSGYFVNSSAIGMMKADNPEMYNAVDCGLIYTSSDNGYDNGKVNAIDPNVIRDAKTGELYLDYGSFWRGIHLFRLNSTGDAIAAAADGSYDISGLNAQDDAYAKEFGAPIVTRWRWAGVEGPYIIYNPDTDYYYMFASYDYFTYNYTIRVGRSKNITGPYLDANGNPLAAEFSATDEPWGYKLAGSYKFADDGAYFAPGHNSVLNDNGDWYLVHHTRRLPHAGATLHVRKMFWTADGWPVVSPERYSGEQLQPLPKELICGSWDFLNIGENTGDVVLSQTLTLLSDGSIAEQNASWSFDGEHTVSIDFGSGRTAELTVIAAYDRDRNCQTLVFTGKDSFNSALWGKKSVYQRVK